MFEFALSEEENIIVASARRFAETELGPFVREHEAAREVRAQAWMQYVQTGFDASEIAGDPDTGISLFARLLILEELAAVDAGAAFALDRYGFARHFLALSGSALLLGDLNDNGHGRGAVIVDEEKRFDFGEGKLSGQHPWIPADTLSLLVVVQPEAAYVVTEGFALEQVRPCGLDAAGGSQLVLDGARVTAVIEDPQIIAQALAHCRLGAAALLTGAARGAFEYAKDYACEREAFGRPIAHHQGLAFLISELSIAVSAARACLWRAAADEGSPDFGILAANAFSEAAEQALHVGPNAVQILGAHGFVRDFPVEKWMRDIRTLCQLFGGRDGAEWAAAENITQRSVALS